MKEYFKILILVTVITTLTILVMNLVFVEKIDIVHIALAGLLNGFVLALVLRKV